MKAKKKRNPTAVQTAILRKIAHGHLNVTMINGRPTCTYADGGVPSSSFDLARFVRAGWIKPAPGCPGLLIGQAWAQRYIIAKQP
jgi:hypothetical protein